ncbi:hypothetical protein B566_EDAN013467 [Ephemera danica]|nr:hypothetical protein B566_EDAN013467 [Ephemera danica]
MLACLSALLGDHNASQSNAARHNCSRCGDNARRPAEGASVVGEAASKPAAAAEMLKCSSNNLEGPTWNMPSHKSSCECCPYGYHIDLDFVRYCEAFNKAASHGSPASKLRERRRQRQSMEVLLGITSPTVWQIEQQLPQVPQEEEELTPLPPTTDSANPNAAIFRDALHKAVLDFEETLQRSKRRPSIHDVSDGFYDISPVHHESSLLIEHLQPLRRSLSASSVASSLSGGSSVALAPNRSVLHPGSLAAATALDSDVASIAGSATSGVSTGALQNIREQMAKSLEKMREMEERIKLIPVLQNQLAALKEEKRLMLLQLKTGEAERNKLISLETEAAALRERVENLSDRGLATPRMQRKFNKEGESSHLFELRIDEGQMNGGPRDRVAMRDVGIECCVLTRDVGVTHSGPKLRNVGTQSKPTEKNLLSFSTIRSESIPPSPTAAYSFHADESNRKQDEGEEMLKTKQASVPPEVKTKVRTVDNSMNTLKPDVKNASCGTELRMNQIYTESQVEVMVEEHGRKVLRDDEVLRTRRRSDKGVMAKPRCSDIAIAATPRVRDVASSECTINDVLCDKCNVRKRSVGVGSSDLLRSPGDGGPASLASLTMIRSKSSDHFNLRPRLRPTSVKTTDTRDLHTFRDTAVNTMKRKLVDTGVGERIATRDAHVETTEPLNVVTECSKCLSRSDSPQSSSVQPLAINSTTPSRIPRLAKPSVNSQNGKRPFNRQDTYTKISVEEKLNLPIVPTITVEEDGVTPAESKSSELAKHSAESRLSTASAASASVEEPSEEEEEAPDEEEETPLYSQGMPGGALYHSTQKKSRKKAEPSREMRGAMKVLSDSLKKSPQREIPHQLKNAVNIIQQEWFRISSTATANPLDVEDYLDCFEAISGQLLEHIVNMSDNSGNTAMHYAVSHGNFDVVSILLDSKVCNINQPNQAGYTSVMLVSLAQMRSETDSQVVQRLFQLADVNVRAKQDGSTALNIAMEAGHRDVGVLLYAHQHFSSRGSSPYSSLKSRRSKP